jgi:ADP-ribose pyrophosphatase YjhB (NUDIX family)
MNKSMDLIHMYVGKNDKASEKTYNLKLSEEFVEKFDLEYFIKDYVLADSFHDSSNPEDNIEIGNYDQLLNVIKDKWKAKKYIGVGVGGVYIRKDINPNGNDDEFVLLYKRYHEPENQLWSILGGSCSYGEHIEDTLKEKIWKITRIDREAITVKDIIKANNHIESREENDIFHYLSPSYYVEINSVTKRLYWKGKSNGRKKVVIITKIGDLDKIGESKMDNICLAWVKVDLITHEANDSRGNLIFAYTTLEAIKCHVHIRNETKNMQNQINQVTDTIKNYQDWRMVKG